MAGLTWLPRLPFFSGGDYSYGVYIFGFPIQQTVAYLLPNHREWWVNFGISLPATLIVAYLSWHYIEKPFLSLRKMIKVSSPNISRKLLPLVVLAVYALFLVVSNNVFPIRQLAKTLYGIL